MPFQGAVQMAAQHLAVEEPDRHLAGRSFGGEILVSGQLHPLHRRQRYPGGLVILQAAGVVDIDQEVRLVEIEITGDPLEGLIVEKADDYLGHAITYSTKPHLARALRTIRRPNRLEHLAHVAMCLRTDSA